MNPQITDLRGNTLEVGDKVAGAFRIGNVAVLRIGEVTGFGERGNALTVEVHWTLSSLGARVTPIDIHGGIEAGLIRFVKIGT